RTHIANRLEVRVSNSSAPKIARQSAAFELSLCYTLGFGIDKDETKASALLKEAEMTPDHLLREIRLTQDLSLEATDQKRMYGKAMPPMRRIGTIDDLYYRKLGNLNSATSRLQQEVGDIESVFGPGHRIVLTLKSTLSKIYIIQEKWEMASELELQILEAASKTVSEEHPDMLATKASIAVILGKLGYWEDAELLESQVLIVCLVNLSIDESSTIKSMERLAAALGEQRKWERAERLAEQALRVREVVDGMQHSDTKNALKIISYIHGEKASQNSQCSNELSLPKQPKWRKSFTDWQEEQKWELRNERIKLQAIKSNETELGSDHPLTLDIMSSLAILYRNQQRWKDAEKLAMEVVAAKKRNHAPLAILQKDMLYLASVYSAQGRWKKAEELQLQIIGLGPDAESRAVERLFLLSHLALTYSRLGRLGEAENLETEVMEGFIKHLEPDHHWTVCSMKRLSSIYTQQGKWKEAEVLALKVLDVRRSSDEADSLEILMGINNLVNVYMGQKRWSEAEELETPVLEKLKTMKGERNPKTLLTMYNLAQIWYAQEKYSVALALMFKVVRLSAAQLGSSHPTSTRRQTTLNTWLLAIDDNLVDAARLDGRETERSNSKDITKTLQRFTEPVEDNNFASTAVRIEYPTGRDPSYTLSIVVWKMSASSRPALSPSTASEVPRGVQQHSVVEIPSMNFRNDFISFLAVAQHYEIDFLSLPWEEGRGRAGAGGTAEVWQANASMRKDFAFKRVGQNGKSHFDMLDEHKLFNALVSEISVVSHPQLRYHQNIVKLEAISFEVIPKQDKVWPVVVLEKAQLRDLKSYMESEAGRITTIGERIGLCADVASALIALHTNGMSHGDIKPGNVLVFRDGAQNTFAKLADFGYAGWARNGQKDVVIKLPKSWPWNAPEHHHRGFTVEAAQKSDRFSFGLLCLWILFFDKPIEDPENADLFANDKQTWSFREHELLDRLKHDDKLRDVANLLVSSRQELSADEHHNLKSFFSSTLLFDPNKRKLDFHELTALLGEDWSAHFLKNWQVRKHIFQCLENSTKCPVSVASSTNAALQISFCYRTGFGVPFNAQKCQSWLTLARHSDKDLLTRLKLAKESMIRNPYRNGELQSLSVDGLLHTQGSHVAYQSGELEEAIPNYRQEIHDMENAFGKHNCCFLELKLKYTSLLEDLHRYAEAEEQLIALLLDLKHDSNYRRLFTELNFQIATSRDVRARLNGLDQTTSSLESKLPDTDDKPASLNKVKACLEDRLPETRHSLFYLAKNYLKQQRYLEAESILCFLTKSNIRRLGQTHMETLYLASTLADALHSSGKYKQAADICLHISDIQTQTLGKQHRETLANRASLASTYIGQGRYDDAEKVIKPIVETQKYILGIDDFSTLTSMSILASVYMAKHRHELSEPLRRQLVDVYIRKFGPDDPETLNALTYLSADLGEQQKWDEVKEITLNVLERTKKVFGESHPKILNLVANLAAVHKKKLLLHVNERERDLFGAKDMDHLRSQSNLAQVYIEQGRYQEGETLIRPVFALLSETLGKNHPSTIVSKIRLARCLEAQQRWQESNDLFLEAFIQRKQLLGAENNRTIEILRLYAFTSLSSLRATGDRLPCRYDNAGLRILEG
ncbi:uncharacterized protein KY384_007120, partial [Bacidia gigantensis]|uniref:uncharacterized protein n=1 Tax=Bacidia gigantensis TaxID=2732470 RepID=UPI001D03B4C0